MKLADWIQVYAVVALVLFGVGTGLFLYWLRELRGSMTRPAWAEQYAPRERQLTNLGLVLMAVSFVWPLGLIGLAAWGLKLLVWQICGYIKDPDVGLVKARTPQDRRE